MSFQIVRNDITKVKADVIVNTANPMWLMIYMQVMVYGIFSTPISSTVILQS